MQVLSADTPASIAVKPTNSHLHAYVVHAYSQWPLHHIVCQATKNISGCPCIAALPVCVNIHLVKQATQRGVIESKGYACSISLARSCYIEGGLVSL